MYFNRHWRSLSAEELFWEKVLERAGLSMRRGAYVGQTYLVYGWEYRTGDRPLFYSLSQKQAGLFLGKHKNRNIPSRTPEARHREWERRKARAAELTTA